MDRQQRYGSNFAGLQPHLATHLRWCNEPILLADVAELQSCLAQLLTIESSWCRLLADKPAHEPDQSCWPLWRCNESTVLTCFTEVLADQSQLQSGKSRLHAYVACLLANLASDGWTRWCQGLQSHIAGLLANFATVFACLACLFADVATVLSGFSPILTHITTVLADESSHGRCLWPWSTWRWRRSLSPS